MVWSKMVVLATQGFNKWQNGFVSRADGCVYAIPCNAEYVLRIDPFHEEGARSQVWSHQGLVPSIIFVRTAILLRRKMCLRFQAHPGKERYLTRNDNRHQPQWSNKQKDKLLLKRSTEALPSAFGDIL